MVRVERISFNEQYGNLHKQWNISKESVHRVIEEFSWKLIDELASDEVFTINPYFMDNRTPDEYIYDILNGQLYEALVCEWFIEQGKDAKRVGSDASGMLIRSNGKKITTMPDLLVDGSYIEIQVSRKGKLKQFNIKKNKGERILRGENTLMMIVDNEYFLVDSVLLSRCEVKPNPCWGGKMCYSVANDIVDYIKL